jgi:hypothetical protein
VLVAPADAMVGLSSGLSIRYYPIFFLENLKLGLVMVQVIAIVSQLGQAVLLHAGQSWSKRIGRIRMAAVFKWIGVFCMMTMKISITCPRGVFVSHLSGANNPYEFHRCIDQERPRGRRSEKRTTQVECFGIGKHVGWAVGWIQDHYIQFCCYGGVFSSWRPFRYIVCLFSMWRRRRKT